MPGLLSFAGQQLRESVAYKFTLTRHLHLASEAKKVPEPVMLKLNPMKSKEFTQEELTGELAKILTPDESSLWRDVIFKQAMKLGNADDAIAEMLKKNETNFRAHLIAANYWREFGKPENAEPEIARAFQLAPDELDVLLASADMALSRRRKLVRENNKQAAEVALRRSASQYLSDRALEQHPKATAVYLATAALDAETRQVSDALAVIRKGLEAIPNSPELLVGQMEYQFRANDAAGASETLEKLRELGLSTSMFDYENARVLMLKEEWLEAVHTFERTLPNLRENQRLFREANLFLGRCYEQIGENDRRLIAFTRSLPLEVTDPLWIPAMLGIAEAQTALGSPQKPLKTYRKLKDWAAGAWIQIARLEMILALKSSEENPNWTATEEAVSMAEKAVAKNLISDSTNVKLLRARLISYRGNPAEARKRLEVLRTERPQEVAVWIELARLEMFARTILPRQSLTLAAGEKEVGDSPELRLVRAELWARAKEPDLATKIAGLASGREKFSLQQQRQLLRGLAELASMIIETNALAAQLWDDLGRAKPFDLNIHLIRFDWAVRARNKGAMEQALQKIAEIDGDNGQSTRLSRAIFLTQLSRLTKDRAPRDEALAILDGLEREHVGPRHASKVALAQGLIHDLNGNTDAALEKYQQALALGEPNPQALRRVMELLSTKKLYSEAMAVFQKLPAATSTGAEVQRLAAEVSLQTDKWKDAIELAAKAVPENSTNYQDQIWLGRVYWSAGDRNKPEAMFRKATELAPEALESWLLLMQYLAATERKNEAMKIFDQAKEKVKKTELSIFLALAYSQLDQVDKAIEAYKQARTEKPNDVRILMAEAEYLLRIGRLSDARLGYRRVIELYSASPADKGFARQRLTLAMAADPDYATSRSAIDLLGADSFDPSQGTETPAQRRSRAVILSLQKDRASKLDAIRLLEENPEGRNPNEQFLLARLHNFVGNQAKVRLVMSDLLKNEKNRIPLYITFYALWLIRADEIREAEEWVTQILKVDPNSLPTAELKARLAAAKKDLAGARAAIVPKADAPDAPLGLIARVCEEIGLYDDAERLLNKFVEQNKATDPQVTLALAAYCGRRGRTVEAIWICEEARTKVLAPAVGEIAIRVLYNATTPTPNDMTKVAGWLEEAIGKAQGKERAMLLQLLAAIRNLQNDYAGAVALYRQVLAENPRDALAMNNLAFLLSARENQHDVALGLIEQAKKVIGPNPSLLDTEAMIRLSKGEVDTASKLLEIVVTEVPSGTAFFHLARVELAAKHDLEARRAWRRALDLGLRMSDLHPLERPAYEKIAAQFK